MALYHFLAVIKLIIRCNDKRKYWINRMVKKWERSGIKSSPPLCTGVKSEVKKKPKRIKKKNGIILGPFYCFSPVCVSSSLTSKSEVSIQMHRNWNSFPHRHIRFLKCGRKILPGAASVFCFAQQYTKLLAAPSKFTLFGGKAALCLFVRRTEYWYTSGTWLTLPIIRAFPPVTWTDGLMLMNVIRLTCSPFSDSKISQARRANTTQHSPFLSIIHF